MVWLRRPYSFLIQRDFLDIMKQLWMAYPEFFSEKRRRVPRNLPWVRVLLWGLMRTSTMLFIIDSISGSLRDSSGSPSWSWSSIVVETFVCLVGKTGLLSLRKFVQVCLRKDRKRYSNSSASRRMEWVIFEHFRSVHRKRYSNSSASRRMEWVIFE